MRFGRTAQERGVSRATFDNAFAGLAFDPKVVASAQSQPEFMRPFGDYIRQGVTPKTASSGVATKSAFRRPLARQGQGGLRRRRGCTPEH